MQIFEMLSEHIWDDAKEVVDTFIEQLENEDTSPAIEDVADAVTNQRFQGDRSHSDDFEEYESILYYAVATILLEDYF